MQTSERARLTAALYRAKMTGKIATLTMSEWEISVKDFNGLCAYCLERPYEVLEHFRPVYIDGTHVKNCVPACEICNRKKSDSSLEEIKVLFGEDTINHIQRYLEARTEIPDMADPDIHPHSIDRWSTRKKTVEPLDQIHASLPDQDTYSIDDLFDFLTCTYADLALMADIHIKTLSKVRYGTRTREDTILKLLQVFSKIYGISFNLRNVTGINVMVNKRLEKKEAGPGKPGRPKTKKEEDAA